MRMCISKSFQCLLCYGLLFSVANAQITFQKVFGGVGTRDYLQSIIQDSDGNYVSTGLTNSYSFILGVYDVYLQKTNINGNLLWSKTFGGIDWDVGYSVIESSDGGYVIAGWTDSYGAGGFDVYLLKTDADGNLLWSKTYGGASLDRGYSVIESSDGGYVITGFTQSYPVGTNNVYLLKTNVNGNLLWSRTFGGAGTDYGYSVIETYDSAYVITGFTGSYGAGGFDVYLLKTDGNGNLLWSRTFGGAASEKAYSVIECSDGGYIITGETSSYGAGGFDVYLLKTDINGNLLWSKTFGGTDADYGYSVIESSDSGYVITGFTYSYGSGGIDVCLIKTDNNGNLLWSKAYGDSLNDYNYSVIESKDGGFITVGATHSWNANASNNFEDEFYMIKTDSSGNSGCNEVDFVPVIGSGAIQGFGSITGSGAIQGSGGSVDNNIPDILTLCQGGCVETLDTLNVTICQGDSFYVAGNYQSVTGIYIDSNLSVGGCDSTTITNLIVNSIGNYNINASICEGDSISAGGAYQIIAGTYYDTLTSSGGCDSIIITELIVNALPIVDAGMNVIINADSCVTLSASLGANYIWAPSTGLSCVDCQNPLACPNQTTSYYLTIMDTNGCVANDSVMITVTPRQLIECSDKIFVPDIFSPNNDGQNDVLQVMGKGFSVIIFMIYDRWGEKVFETDSKSYGWDGKYKGKMMNPAVFVYHLEVLCTNASKKFITKGDITLVR